MKDKNKAHHARNDDIINNCPDSAPITE